jgi:hypothetical protein
MEESKMKKISLVFMFILLPIFLIIRCEGNKQNDNTKQPEIKDKANEQKPILPSESLGIFTGEELAYSMKLGNQMIPMPSSKWRMEISSTLLEMQQVIDGQTIHYSGNYNIEFQDEVKIVIKARLIDDKYNQDFTPTLRFNKATKTWFLEGIMGSEGCSLAKE